MSSKSTSPSRYTSSDGPRGESFILRQSPGRENPEASRTISKSNHPSTVPRRRAAGQGRSPPDEAIMPPRGRGAGASGSLNDGGGLEEPAPLLLVDPEPGQEAVADRL